MGASVVEILICARAEPHGRLPFAGTPVRAERLLLGRFAVRYAVVKVAKVASARSVVVAVKAATGAGVVGLAAQRVTRRRSVARWPRIKGRRARFSAARLSAPRVASAAPKSGVPSRLAASTLNALKLAAAVVPRVRARRR